MNNLENGDGGNSEIQLADEILESTGRELSEAAVWGEFIDENSLEQGELLTHESIFDDEKFVNNYRYLNMLNDKMFQGIVDGKLYREGKIKKPIESDESERPNLITIIDIDFLGSTANLEKLMEEFGQEGIGDAGRQAVDEQSQTLMAVHNAVVDTFKLCGIKGDKFMGDGARGICEAGVQQAVYAAHLLQQVMTKIGLDVRIGIDVGDVTLVGCGTASMRKAFATGDTVDNAERIQKNAEPGQIALSGEAGKWIEMAAPGTTLKSIDDGSFVIDNLAVSPGWGVFAMERQLKISPDDLEYEIRAREAFLPASRVRDLRYQFINEQEHEPKQEVPSIHEVSTLVIELSDMEERNFEDANDVVSTIFEMISKSGGDVDKMDGTRIMANFVSGGNDFDCVQAGVRISEKLQEMEISFKMSAARSKALSIVMGGDRTIIGRAANMAHRQIEDAPENVLVVDEDLMEKVHQQVKKSKSIGQSDYKGIGERERFVISELKGWYELAKPEVLLFRDNELNQLDRDFELVKQTGGRCMAIAGRPGFGKSALVAEFLDRKKREGNSTFFGRAEEYTCSQSFSVWRNLFDSVFGSDMSNVDEKVSLLLEKYPDLQELVSLLNPILKTNFEESYLVKALEDRPQDKEELRAEVVNKLLGLFATENSPAVVLLEDLQFFDEDSKNLLTNILKQISDSNIQLLITTRLKNKEGTLNLPPKEFEKMVNVNNLELGGAVPEFSEAMWKQNNGEDYWQLANTYVNFDRRDFEEDHGLFKRVFEEISSRTEGNVLAFQLYLRHLIDKGYFESNHLEGSEKIIYSLVRDGHGNPPIIPDEELNLGDIVGNEGKRFKDLESPALKDILSVASVAGSSFTLEKLLYVYSDYTEDGLRELLQQAEERGFVRHISGDSYAFANNEIQPAIYQTLSEEWSDIQYYHRLFAQYHREATQDDLNTIGFHVRHGDDHLATLEIMDETIDKFKESGARLNASKWASRALGCIKQNGWKVMPAWNRDKTPELKDIDVLEVSKDGLIHGEIERLLTASGILRRIRPKDAASFTERALSEFDESHHEGELSNEDSILRCKILSNHARNLDLGRRFGEASDRYEEVFDMVNLYFNMVDFEDKNSGKQLKEMMREFVFFHGIHLSDTGQYELATDEYDRALLYCGNAGDEGAIRNGIATNYMRSGDLEKAINEFESLIKIAEDHEKLQDNLGVYLMNLGEVHVRLGELKSAYDYYEQSLNAVEELKIKDTAGRLNTLANLGMLYKMDNKFEEALEVMTSTVREAKKRGNVNIVSILEPEMVVCCLEIGDSANADILIDGIQSEERDNLSRSLTLGATKQFMDNPTDFKQACLLFEKGIVSLGKIKDWESIADDKYYFGTKLIQSESADDRKLGKEYLRDAKKFYFDNKVSMVLIPAIDQLVSLANEN